MPNPSPFQQARFLTSSPRLDSCPPDEGWEVAFAGRSNAGKSSVINALTGNRNLARTSKTPGRTQLINFFDLGGMRRLVDLPGYGFAKVAKSVREAWSRNLDTYLRARRSLVGVILVMDCRHPLKPFDLDMIDWSIAAGLRLHVLLTKSDKLSRGAALTTQRQVANSLRERGTGLSCQLFSATRGDGIDGLVEILSQWYGWETLSPSANPTSESSSHK